MDNGQIKKQNFLVQGSILAIAGLLVRLIGLIYRIPMIAIIGTKGSGYYTSAYSVYTLFLILSSYTFPSAISKIISQKLANGRFLDIKNTVKSALILAFFVGLLMFSLMYFGADFISLIFRKPLLRFALRALAPTLFIMAFLGIFRGIFQGMGNMVPTAISQILEQIANAISSIVFAFILVGKGRIANLIYDSEEYTYAFGARGGAIGTGVGAFVALAVLIFMFLNLFKKYKKFLNNNNYYEPESKSKIYYVLITTMVPIIISSTIYNVTSVVDDLVFSNTMTFLKSDLNIVVLWGIYGNYHLLFNIPVAISSSLTASIIPSISQSVAINNAREVVLKVRYSIKYTMLIVLPAFVGLYVLADPICKVLFNSEYVDILINVLRIGSVAVVFFSLATVTNGILQGLGYLNVPVKNAVISLVAHVAISLVLLIVFKLNIYAIIISMIFFSLILFALNQRFINSIIRYKNPKMRTRNLFTYFLMFLSSVVMGFTAFILNSRLETSILRSGSQVSLVIRLVICIGVSLVEYLVLIILFGVVRKRDAEYIPFISKLSVFLRG